jgi:TonB family protein
VNVEAPGETLTQFWPRWQDEVINGAYSLRRLLHASEHSAVFLAECKAQDPSVAAIKIIPAERVTLAQLSHWRAAVGLSHPHLIRLLDAGLCQLGGRQFLYVVMEHAEQTLSDVLLRRALTPEEVQEMLPPVAGALAFLHGKQLVQGQLKPANVLVVNDQLKLASDTIRPAGEPRASIDTESSPYDPPEATGGRFSAAGDIWALGVTMVEALTQHVPSSSDERSFALPPSAHLPALADIVRRCLSHDPASRPTASDLEAQFGRTPAAVDIASPANVVHEAPARAADISSPVDVLPEPPPRPTPLPESPRLRALVPIAATALILVAGVWVGLRLFHSHPPSPHPAADTARPRSLATASAPRAAEQTPAPPQPAPAQVTSSSVSTRSKESRTPPALSRPSDQVPQTVPGSALSSVYEQLPSVPHSASATIQGHVKVTLLVIVDPSGSVIDAILENPGPSPYFARLAKQAAKQWKFAPAETQDSRQELLRFEFTRSGTSAHAVAARS